MVIPDTVMVTDTDTAMVDTDTVTITARDLLNPKPTTVTDMAVDTDTVDTVDTVMAVMVTMVELLLRIKSLEKFCLNNLLVLTCVSLQFFCAQVKWNLNHI